MAYLIVILLGVVIGGFASEVFGAFVGGVLGFLLVRTRNQGRQIEALGRRVEADAAVAAATHASRARDADTASAAATGAPQVTPVPLPTPLPTWATGAVEPLARSAVEMPATASARTGDAPRADVDAVVADAVVSVPEPAFAPAIARRSPPPPRPPGLLDAFQRWLTGGNTIVKVGVLILFAGLAFLAKYAAEHTHVPIELRLAAIGAAGIALLLVGWRLRLRRPGYAQVLQGGAVAILYLTLFAAFKLYAVVDAVPAFAVMVALAGLAAALAVLQDARALAVMGALGGFAAPFLVSTGSNNYVALFTYYFILDAGIAAVAWSKTWRSLNLIGFFATFVVATAWGVLMYSPTDFATSEGFLGAFFLLFVLIMILPARRAAPAAAPPGAGSAVQRLDGWVASSLLFGLPTVTFALQYGLVRDVAGGTALSALGLAAFYVGLATWMKKRPELGITFFASLAIATVFLTLVIPFALDERSTAGAWALEGAGLVWIGFRQQRLLARVFGYGLMFFSALSMLFGHQRFGVPTQWVNAYLINGLLSAAGALIAARVVARQRERATLHSDESVMEGILIGLATAWLVATAAIEMDAFVPSLYARSAVLVVAAAIASIYAVLSRRLAWPAIAMPTLALAPILFLVALANAAFLHESPLLDGGWWAWPLAFAGHLLVLGLVSAAWPSLLRHIVHATGAVTLALFGALVGRSATEGWGDAASAWPWLGWLIAPALLLLALPQPALARRWPVRAAPSAYPDSAAAVIAAGLWIWTLVANAASDGSAAPLPHVPLVNPLDIGIGLALVAILMWLRSAGRLAPWSVSAVAAAAFVWLNAMLVRAFHHYADVPYDLDAWSHSLAVQTGITLLWATTALIAMWVSARRAVRLPWVAGAALLGAVVLKLLVVDLSGTGSVTRIVSFIGVGILMLVIGYVAPLPSRQAASPAAAA